MERSTSLLFVNLKPPLDGIREAVELYRRKFGQPPLYLYIRPEEILPEMESLGLEIKPAKVQAKHFVLSREVWNVGVPQSN